MIGDRRWRKLARDLWLHKSRCAVVVLAIAVGVAGAGIVLNSWAMVTVATREGYLASNPPAATLRADSVTAVVLDAARSVSGVADAEARRTIIGRVQAGGVWRTAVLFVRGGAGDARIGVIKPESGAWPAPDGDLIIERSSLDFSGVTVGEQVLVEVGPEGAAGAALRVSGVARDVGLAPGWMEHIVYGFVSPATAAAIGSRADFNELLVTVEDRALDRAAVQRVAMAVQAAVERAGHRVLAVDVPEPGEHIHAAQMNSMLMTQGAFGVLALVLSGFLVVNLVSAMLAGQVREIGVMKAMGARTEQLASMYVALALALGLVASGLALPVAHDLGMRYAALRADLLNFDIAGFRVPWWVLASQVAAGVLVPVGAAAIPVWRACRIPVSAALRDVGIAEDSFPSDGIVVRVAGAGRPTLLAFRNAFRRRQRLVLTLLALGTGGAVFLGARNLKVAIAGSMDLIYTPHRYDLTVRFAQPVSADSIASVIAATPGVEAAEAWASTRAAVFNPDGAPVNSFPVLGVPAGSQLLALQPVRGRWLTATDTAAVVISRGIAINDTSLAVGRTATLVMAGRTVRWEIVGIVDAGPMATAWAIRETVNAVLGRESVELGAVRFSSREAGSRLAAIQELRGALGAAGLVVASTQLLDEARRATEDHLLLVAEFLGGMAWLMIVVGGLGLASTMSLSVLERTREIGVLRAIGARHGDIMTAIQVEGLAIAVLSWAVAIPLSVPMSLILGRVFGSMFFAVPDRYLPEATGVVTWFVLVVVVSGLASLFPALRAMRITTAQALAYE